MSAESGEFNVCGAMDGVGSSTSRWSVPPVGVSSMRMVAASSREGVPRFTMEDAQEESGVHRSKVRLAVGVT